MNYLVYQSNIIFGQCELNTTDNFEVAWSIFNTASKSNDKGQTTYLIIGE